MRARTFVAIVALSALAFGQSSADVEKAKTFFTAGAQAYERGDFLGAIQAFDRANQLAPRDAILFSIAQAHRRQYYIEKNAPEKAEHLKAAVLHYRKYLERAHDGNRRADAAQALAELGPAADRLTDGGSTLPTKASTRVSIGSNAQGAIISMDGAPATPAPFIHDVPPGDHSFSVSADGYITKSEKLRVTEGDFVAREVQLKELSGKLVLNIDSGAQVLIDGRIVGSAPFSSAVEIESGTRQIAITRNGHEPVVREIEIGRGETKSLDVSMSSTGQRRISRVLLGAGGGGLLLGGVFLGIAYAAESSAVGLREKRETMGLTAEEAARYEGARNDRNGWLGAALVAFGTSIAIGGTGLLLYLFDQPPLNLSAPKKEKKPDKPLDILNEGPAISLSPNGILVTGSF